MTDWSGDPDELLTLDDASTLIPGADAATLKRLVRVGKLRAYRPGRRYLTTRADVRAAVKLTRVGSTTQRTESPAVPNALGLSSTDLANLRLDQVLNEALEKKKAARKPPRTRDDSDQ